VCWRLYQVRISHAELQQAHEEVARQLAIHKRALVTAANEKGLLEVGLYFRTFFGAFGWLGFLEHTRDQCICCRCAADTARTGGEATARGGEVAVGARANEGEATISFWRVSYCGQAAGGCVGLTAGSLTTN
jgi:hypothetical protein